MSSVVAMIVTKHRPIQIADLIAQWNAKLGKLIVRDVGSQYRQTAEQDGVIFSVAHGDALTASEIDAWKIAWLIATTHTPEWIVVLESDAVVLGDFCELFAPLKGPRPQWFSSPVAIAVRLELAEKAFAFCGPRENPLERLRDIAKAMGGHPGVLNIAPNEGLAKQKGYDKHQGVLTPRRWGATAANSTTTTGKNQS